MLAVILLVLVLVMFYVDFLHIFNNIAKILRINYIAKFLTVQNIFRWLWLLRSHSEEGEGPRPENIAR